MKMLYILNIAKRVNNFSYTSMIAAKECGFEYHIAGNWSYKDDEERIEDENKYGIIIHQIDFVRKPYSLKNRRAYKQLLELCKKEKYDVIHCNTPVGGLLGRLVAKKCKVKTVIYQAHGFHFYRGAPLLNWLVYYPIEKWLAHKTDVLITINKEDYELAKKKMHLKKNGQIEYIPGVGVDFSLYKSNSLERLEKRKELNLSDNEVMLISTGDLIKRKNYFMLIDAFALIKNPNVRCYVCGTGPQELRLKKKIADLKLEDRFFLLGFRNDVKSLLSAADIFVLPSLQEGLSRSLMEAMASGLPVVCSNIRGNSDLIVNGVGGFLCDANDQDGFCERIISLCESVALRERMGGNNLKAIDFLGMRPIIDRMKTVYSKFV